MTVNMDQMKTTDYGFERDFRYKQSWFGTLKKYNPSCVLYLDAVWIDSSAIVE